MKTLLPLIFFFLLILSCEKPEPLNCYQCTTYMNSEPITTVSICGFTEPEMLLYEAGLQGQATAITNTPCVTECIKK